MSAVTTGDKFLCAVKNVGAEAGSVQNPTGFYKGKNHELRTIKVQFAPQENRLEALRAFKKKSGHIFKRKLVNRFRTGTRFAHS